MRALCWGFEFFLFLFSPLLRSRIPIRSAFIFFFLIRPGKHHCSLSFWLFLPAALYWGVLVRCLERFLLRREVSRFERAVKTAAAPSLLLGAFGGIWW